MNKPEYIKCPRCELNYILKKDKLCKVCKDEIESVGRKDDGLIVCPICKTNYINSDDDMCAMCAQEKDIDDEIIGEESSAGENWRMYIENDDTETEEDEIGDMSSIVDVDDELLSTDDDDEELEDEDIEIDPEENESEDESEEDFDEFDFDEIDDEDDDDEDDDEDYM